MAEKVKRNAEKVLVVKTEHLPGWATDAQRVQPITEMAVNTLQTEWLPRNQAEKDELYRQLIPYLLVENHNNHFAVYLRNGTEKRLHGLFSCGVGGHVNPEDESDSVAQTLKYGAIRELHEEFKGLGDFTMDLLGYISETRTSVGRVHMGVVYKIKLSGTVLPDPAEELQDLVWLPALKIQLRNLELWSRLALELL